MGLSKREQYLRYRAKNPEMYRYSKYRQAAKARGHSFELSKEEFFELLHGECHYCGSTSRIGVDRKDSSVGYITDNCVSCCYPCNMFKLRIPYNVFIERCTAIADHVRLT
jgi:hypothetical protein